MAVSTDAKIGLWMAVGTAAGGGLAIFAPAYYKLFGAALILMSWLGGCYLIFGVHLREYFERRGDASVPAIAPGNREPSYRWAGSKKIYDDPFVVYSTVVTSADNDRLNVFEVPWATDGAFIDTIVEIDRLHERVQAGVTFPRAPGSTPLHLHTRAARTSIRLPSDRLLALRTHAAPEASPTTIRVRIASWTIGPVKV